MYGASTRERVTRASTGFLVLATLIATTPQDLPAQTLERHELAANGWVSDASLGALNAAVAGLIAGVRSSIHGGAFWSAAGRGAIGGATIYGGKRIASLEGAPPRWLSRQVGAVGVAMTDNAAMGRSLLSKLYFPVGPLAIELDRSAGEVEWGISVSGRDLVSIGWAIDHPDLHLNWGESLATGVPVFEGSNGVLMKDGNDGSAIGGVVLIEATGRDYRSRILQHEVVHVVQADALNRLLGNPVERWLVRSLSGGRVAADWLRLDAARTGLYWSLETVRLLDPFTHPFELEAQWVEYH